MNYKKSIVTLLFVSAQFIALSCMADQRVGWSMEMAGGFYEPDAEDWSEHYGSKSHPEIGLSLGYRLFNVVEIGSSINYGRDKGSGVAPSTQASAGEVTHEMLPVDLYIMLRARFSENQWLVPYIGAGYTHFLYRQTISDQDDVKGATGGSHTRAGIQFLLDVLEPHAAATMRQMYGVVNSYWFVEMKQINAEAGDDNLEVGGKSIRTGVMFEY